MFLSRHIYGPLPVHHDSPPPPRPNDDDDDDQVEDCWEAAVLHPPYDHHTSLPLGDDGPVSSTVVKILERGTVGCDDNDNDKDDNNNNEGDEEDPRDASFHAPSPPLPPPQFQPRPNDCQQPLHLSLVLPPPPPPHTHHTHHTTITSYHCPLTMRVMKDPVLDRCGHCFEREAILSWLEQQEEENGGGGCCPISRKPLHPHDLMDAVEWKKRIEQWKEGHTSVVVVVVEGEGSRIPLDKAWQSSSSSSSSSFPMELMLLPQERKVLSMIQCQERVRKQREWYSKYYRYVRWAVVSTVTLIVLAVVFAAIYSFHITIRAPL